MDAVRITPLHRWDVAPGEAIALQQQLAPQVERAAPLDLDRLALVGGVDVSVKDDVSRAAVVVLRYPSWEVVEVARAAVPTPFPYIPGLLSFREGAVILEAMRQIRTRPDVFIFDGQGTAHPRRIGIASHIGLFIDVPTVGCAKSRLAGRHAVLPPEKGAWVPLRDGGETIGAAVRTRTGVKPVFVSVGHRATLETSIALVLRCTTRYKLPEPTRAAHRMAALGAGEIPDDQLPLL